MDDLVARFLPQFVALARARVATAITVATLRDQSAAPTLVRELHTLAGEAGLLGLGDVVPIARDCEAKAKVLQRTLAGPDAELLLAALHQLDRVIESIAASLPG
jgi:chemotaxis protein histidine kinase CheA